MKFEIGDKIRLISDIPSKYDLFFYKKGEVYTVSNVSEAHDGFKAYWLIRTEEDDEWLFAIWFELATGFELKELE